MVEPMTYEINTDELVAENERRLHSLLRKAYAGAKQPVHTHTHSFPIFGERRGDASPIRLGLRCACGDTVGVDYLTPPTGR